MLIRSITAQFAAVLLAVLVLAAPARAADYAQRADAMIRAYAEAGRLSGTVLVAKDGRPMFLLGKVYATGHWF